MFIFVAITDALDGQFTKNFKSNKKFAVDKCTMISADCSDKVDQKKATLNVL